MSATALPVAVAGAAGRMGRSLVHAIAQAADVRLVGALERAGAPGLGGDVGRLAGLDPIGVTLTADLSAAAQGANVWIDFSSATACLAALQALPPGVAAVIGATGFDGAQAQALAQAAQTRAILRSGNFSLGVNLLMGLAREAARRLGPDWDVEILEAHHRAKVDAPSGTALMLGEAVAAGRGAGLDQLRLAPHDGLGPPRPEGGIGFAVLRGGGVVGEHTVIFAGPDEQLRLEHRAGDRMLFARGALAAARWVAGRPPGLYAMTDVLGL